MKIADILNVIRDLSMSKGSYGRLYRDLMECREYDPDKWDAVVAELEAQNFCDPVDVVMFLEC